MPLHPEILELCRQLKVNPNPHARADGSFASELIAEPCTINHQKSLELTDNRIHFTTSDGACYVLFRRYSPARISSQHLP